MAQVVTDPTAMTDADRQAVVAPFDPAKMHADLRGAIKAGFDGIRIQNPEPQVVRVEVPVPQSAPAKEEDALTSAIKEVVGPMLAPLNMQVADSRDSTRFYRSSEFAEAAALVPGLSDKIEDMFGKAMAAGQPRSREDLFYWFRGKNPQVFVEATARRKADNLAAVGRDAAVAGAGSPGPSSTTVLPVETDALWGMGREALDAALEGKEF